MASSVTLDDILAEYQIGFVVGDKDVQEHLHNFKQALQTAVLAAAPEKQVFTDIPEVDHTGKVIKVHKGETYTREMYFYNRAIDHYTKALRQLFESEG